MVKQLRKKVYVDDADLFSAVHEFQRELTLSHALLFGGKGASKSIGSRFYGIDIDFATEIRRIFPEDTNKVLEARDFSILHPRIILLLRSMEEWKPRTLRDFFISGYSRRLDWWVAMFALIVGAISFLSLAVSFYQAVLGRKQLSLAQEGKNGNLM